MKTNYRHHWGGGGAFLLAAFAAFFVTFSAQAGAVSVTVTNPADTGVSYSSLNDAATNFDRSTGDAGETATFNISSSETLTEGLTFQRIDNATTLSGTYHFIGGGTGITITGADSNNSGFDNADRVGSSKGVDTFHFQNLTITNSIKRNNIGIGGGAIRMTGVSATTPGSGDPAYADRVTLILDNVTLTRNQIITTGAVANQATGGAGFTVNGGGQLVRLQNFTITENEVHNGFTSGGNWTYGGGFRAFNTLAYEIGAGTISKNLAEFTGNGNGNWVIGGGASIETDAGNADNGYGSESSSVAFTGTTISENTASIINAAIGEVQGGGLYLSNTEWEREGKNTTSTLTNVTVSKNTASGVNGVNARGGGIAQNGNTITTLTGGTVSDNTATTATGAAQGGGIYSNNAWRNGDAVPIAPRTKTALSISGTTLSGNKAIATGAGAAQGGAVYMNIQTPAGHTGTFDFANATFTGNSATSASGAAQGGAIWSNFAFADNGSTFTGNDATGNGAAGGQGGAIYSQAGDVTLANSTFTTNHANGTGAAGGAIYSGAGNVNVTNSSFTGNSAAGKGGAIFMDTTAGARTVNLAATGTGLTKFENNTAGGVRNSIHFEGANGGTVAIAVNDATAKVHILDAISAGGGGTLTVTKNGAGEFGWGGANVNAAATTVRITDGTLDLATDFTLAATGGQAMTVDLTGADAITFDAARKTDLAIFDFTQAGTKTLAVGTPAKPTLTAMAGAVGSAGKRPVDGFTVADYLLVSGIDQTAGQNFIDNIAWQNTNTNNWTYVNDLGWQGDDPASGKIVANAGHNSPFEHSGGNTLDAKDSFKNLVNETDWGKNVLTDDEWKAMQNNARAITPDIAMQATNVMLAGVMRVQSAAVDYGVRNPHRLRMRMEDSYTRRSYRPTARRAAPAAAGTATATTDPVTGETIVFQQGMLTPGTSVGIENYQAYPAMRLEDCYFPGVGLRLWAGYTGDWKVQREYNGISGYDSARHGVLLGVNYDIGTVASVGVYGGYTNADVDARGYDAEVDSDNGHFGIIGRVSPLATMPELSFYADAGYHFSNNDSVRTMRDPANVWSATGSFDQDVWTFGLGAEYVIRAGMFNITPQADVRFSHLSQDGFTEVGNSGTRTSVGGLTADQFTHRLGAEFSYDFLFAGGVVTPALSLGWRHDWGSRRHNSNAYYLLDPARQAFNVAANSGSRDSADIGLAVKSVYNITSSTKLGVNLSYNLNLGGRSHSHTLYAGVELGF